jgi:hypothetical protein
METEMRIRAMGDLERKTQRMFIHLLICAVWLLIPSSILAAVGCTLNDPDRDIKRIFPASTGYRTTFVTIKEKGGEDIAKAIEEKLGDELDPVYESIDVPYAYYTVLKGTDAIGLVHGVNQKGTYGGIQLILATDLTGRITEFYYQKMSSPEASVFRKKNFTDQFKGLGLADFLLHDGPIKEENVEDRIAQIKDPSTNSHADFINTLRGLKKNLILIELFNPLGAAEDHPEPEPSEEDSIDDVKK